MTDSQIDHYRCYQLENNMWRKLCHSIIWLCCDNEKWCRKWGDCCSL